MSVSILPCGDMAFSVVVGDVISPEVNARVRGLCRALEGDAAMLGFELVPTYCGVTIHYDPMRVSAADLRRRLALAAEQISQGDLPPAEYVTIPVYYGGAAGPDLPDVAALCGLSERQVIDIHASAEYLIYMLGFTPGFPYMGGMDKRIAVPRLEAPRAKTPWGAVGIAGEQTGIYPSQSPGGWRIIGRTPLRLFDPATGATLLKAGMRLRFRPIGLDEYELLMGGALQ